MEMCPKISIVTPSFNQGQFLEEAILSVINQNYPNLEYIIIDGGSTDNSVEIIKKYESHLHSWCSEPDEGHYNAINKGFAKATGEVFAWLNSDDMYCPWALKTVGSIFAQFKDLKWLTTMNQLVWDSHGYCTFIKKIPGYSREAFLDGCYFSRKNSSIGFIQQESTFWRRELWKKVNGIRTEFCMAGDFDLWARFYEYANLYSVISPLGGFRVHDKNRSLVTKDYIMEAEHSLEEMRQRLEWKGLPQRTILENLIKKISSSLHLEEIYFGTKKRTYTSTNIIRSDSIKGDEWKMTTLPFSVR
jgi:glycosyltransferase involved in cell wall biosynthesis